MTFDLSIMTIKPTSHFIKTMKEKGFSAQVVTDTLLYPKEVYPSRSHPGQYRVTGNGICIVGKPEGHYFFLITVYADRIVTPVRPDQLNTPEGRRFAQIGRQA